MTLLDTLKVYKAMSYEDHAETTTTHPEHNNVDEFIAEIINSDNKSQRYRNVYYSNYNNNNDNDGNHNDGNCNDGNDNDDNDTGNNYNCTIDANGVRWYEDMMH